MTPSRAPRRRRRRCLSAAAATSAASGRTPLLYGWGIHGTPFFGVAYNIHGRACVRVEFKRRRGLFRNSHVYIGTDDPEGLAKFLRSKL